MRDLLVYLATNCAYLFYDRPIGVIMATPIALALLLYILSWFWRYHA